MYRIWPVEWEGELLGAEKTPTLRRVKPVRVGGLGELTSVVVSLSPILLPNAQPRGAVPHAGWCGKGSGSIGFLTLLRLFA